MMALLCVVMTCGVNKGFTFFAGFWQAYVFLNAFHWKWFFLGLVFSLPLAAVIGGIAALVGLL